MTADQTLEHPWLKRKIPPPPPELITTKENLRTFVDNYHNINGIDNNVDHIINTKPLTLSAVELIAASDKEFINRSSVKSFSNDRNENPLPPVRFPIVVTNKNLPAVMNDNNLDVDNVPSTNDDALNIMNANTPSMPCPTVLDNASAALPIEHIIVSVSEPNLSQTLHVNEIENNNAPVTNPSVGPMSAVKTEDLPINLPLGDIPPRVLAAPEVPVASLSFISKSLPAAAAMLDENMVDQLKPLHIPLIPTLPALDAIDEPIVVHPPVFSTTLPPPKRGSIDVDSVLSAQNLDEIDKMLAKRGSFDIISLIPKRGSKDIGAKISERESIEVKEIPKNEPLDEEMSPQYLFAHSLKPASPDSNLIMAVTNTSVVEPTSSEPKPEIMFSTNDNLGQLPSIDVEVTKGVVSPKHEIPQVQALAPATVPVLARSQPITYKDSQGVFPIVPSSPGEPVVPVPESPDLSQPPMDDVFIPQPPAVAKIVTSPFKAGISPVPTVFSPPIGQNVVTPEPTASTSFHPIRTYSPSLPSPKPYVAPETSRSPVSPIISSIISPSRRESPLQKTLDDIPKLSSEILSSLKNMPSLSRTTSYDVSPSKTSFVSKRTSSTESSSNYSSHERVSSPRVVSFTEHTTSSFVTSMTPKVYPKIQGVTLGKTQTEEKSAFAHVSSRDSYIKRTGNKETDTSQQPSQRVETRSSKVESSRIEMSRSEKASKAEADALAFKLKLRSTAPWFSERKAAEADKNIEKKSLDINALLKENLGPLERSPWAREIRQISAKLVEMSSNTTARKQEDERLLEANNQQSAKRQKFKVSVLNRDVVFGTAREFYIGGEVSGASSPLKDQLQGKQAVQPQTSKSASSASTRSSRLSPERKTRSTTFKSSSTK